jgi:hypothetical protein
MTFSRSTSSPSAAVQPAEALPPVAIVDIDGVVADVRHRVRHLQDWPADWASFFAAAGLDLPLPVGVARVRALEDSGHEIVWLTGRPEWLRDITEDWLADQGLPAGTLLMRPNADRRPARSLKAGIVRALSDGRPVPGHAAGPPRSIAIVVDDDSLVVERLRADGWPVEQADWVGLTVEGASRLAEAQEEEGRT